MKIFSKINIIGLVLLMAGFASCETADQTPAEPISPNYKPTVTVTSDVTGKVNEGSTVTYTISFDKPIERAVTFTPTITGGTADDHDYEALEPVTIAPYTTSVELKVVLLQDYLVETDENLQIQLEILTIADQFLVHPDTVLAPIDLTIASPGDPTLLTINFAWDNDNDNDMLVYSDTATYPATLWGTGGATSANPEIDHSIWLEDPTGDYYVTVVDYDEGVNFNYTFSLQQPNGTIQTITGTFDGTTYPYENFVGPASWGSPNAYKILKVVNDGTKFVVTKL